MDTMILASSDSESRFRVRHIHTEFSRETYRFKTTFEYEDMLICKRNDLTDVKEVPNENFNVVEIGIHALKAISQMEFRIVTEDVDEFPAENNALYSINSDKKSNISENNIPDSLNMLRQDSLLRNLPIPDESLINDLQRNLNNLKIQNYAKYQFNILETNSGQNEENKSMEVSRNNNYKAISISDSESEESLIVRKQNDDFQSIFQVYQNSLRQEDFNQRKREEKERRKTEKAKLIETLSCNCLQSRCAKMYCECFKNGVTCDPQLCRCKDCLNESSRIKVLKELRQNSIQKIQAKILNNELNTQRFIQINKFRKLNEL